MAGNAGIVSGRAEISVELGTWEHFLRGFMRAGEFGHRAVGPWRAPQSEWFKRVSGDPMHANGSAYRKPKLLPTPVPAFGAA